MSVGRVNFNGEVLRAKSRIIVVEPPPPDPEPEPVVNALFAADWNRGDDALYSPGSLPWKEKGSTTDYPSVSSITDLPSGKELRMYLASGQTHAKVTFRSFFKDMPGMVADYDEIYWSFDFRFKQHAQIKGTSGSYSAKCFGGVFGQPSTWSISDISTGGSYKADSWSNRQLIYRTNYRAGSRGSHPGYGPHPVCMGLYPYMKQIDGRTSQDTYGYGVEILPTLNGLGPGNPVPALPDDTWTHFEGYALVSNPGIGRKGILKLWQDGDLTINVTGGDFCDSYQKIRGLICESFFNDPVNADSTIGGNGSLFRVANYRFSEARL